MHWQGHDIFRFLHCIYRYALAGHVGCCCGQGRQRRRRRRRRRWRQRQQRAVALRVPVRGNSSQPTGADTREGGTGLHRARALLAQFFPSILPFHPLHNQPTNPQPSQPSQPSQQEDSPRRVLVQRRSIYCTLLARTAHCTHIPYVRYYVCRQGESIRYVPGNWGWVRRIGTAIIRAVI